MSLEIINKALDGIEVKLNAMSAKADGELATIGKVSTDTKTALDTIGVQQRELADRLLTIEQKNTAQKNETAAGESFGAQFVKASAYTGFRGNDAHGRARVEVKNTITNAAEFYLPPFAFNICTWVVTLFILSIGIRYVIKRLVMNWRPVEVVKKT